MGKQLFIPRTVSAADATDYVSTDMSAGEAAIVYPASTGLVAIAATDITDTSMPFQIIWRKYSTSDIVVSSPVLTLSELVAARKLTSDAGTQQIVDLAVTVPTTPLVGDTYMVKIIDTTPGTANLTKKTFEYVATATDYAASDIVDALVSDISTDTDVRVSASDNTTDLRLTGTGTTNHFRVAVENNAGVDWTITYTSDVRPGRVSQAYLTDLETKMKSHGEGITNTIWFAKPYTSEVYAAIDCLGIFDFNLRKPAKHGMGGINFEPYTLYIATSDNTVCTTLQTVWLYGIDSTSDVAS